MSTTRKLGWALMVGAAICALGTGQADAGGTVAQTDGKAAIARAPAPEKAWTGSLGMGYDSLYMFRGVNIQGKDGGDASNLVWGKSEVSSHGFTLGAWYASSTSEDYDELDVNLDYTHSFDFGLNLSGGYYYYLFPYASDDTHELYIGAEYTKLPFNLVPSLYYYHDVDMYDGGYLEAKLATSIPVVKDVLCVNPYALVSWDFEYNTEDSGWNHFQAGVELAYNVSENVTLAGYGAVAVPMDVLDDSQDTEFWGGVYLSVSF